MYIKGGTIAGNARKETEKELGRKVMTRENYLKTNEGEKRKQLKDGTIKNKF